MSRWGGDSDTAKLRGAQPGGMVGEVRGAWWLVGLNVAGATDDRVSGAGGTPGIGRHRWPHRTQPNVWPGLKVKKQAVVAGKKKRAKPMAAADHRSGGRDFKPRSARAAARSSFQLVEGGPGKNQVDAPHTPAPYS